MKQKNLTQNKEEKQLLDEMAEMLESIEKCDKITIMNIFQVFRKVEGSMSIEDIKNKSKSCFRDEKYKVWDEKYTG